MSKTGLQKDDLIPISGLKECPVRITLHTDPQIEMIKRTAKADPEGIAAIDVAELADEKTMVIVDGHARVESVRSSGIDRIRARLHRVQSMADAVILHVRLNQRSQLNPLKFYDAFEFLKENGFDSNEISRQLRLSESYSRLLKISLPAKPRALLEQYLDELASKYSLVHLPVYVIEAVARIKDEQDQAEAVKMMIQMIPQNVSEFKFGFPSYDQLEIAFSSFRKEDRKREPIIFTVKDSQADKERKDPQSRTSSFAPEDEPAIRTVPSKEEIDEAREIISNAPHRALVRCPHGAKYLVDMKDHTISEVKEKDNVISISGDSSEPVFMIPSKYAEFLQLDYGDPVYFKSFDTPRQLLKFVDDKKDRIMRTVLISPQRI